MTGRAVPIWPLIGIANSFRQRSNIWRRIMSLKEAAAIQNCPMTSGSTIFENAQNGRNLAG
ncbi:MAG: hypothetical protein CMO80_01975 [Verrucomicrobiales bacterium]|nr:hypothetical protein [Verrucomicrobiales bacterium]